ncbi:transcriptional regulator [Micromonospora sp. M42]|nr:transcriptional regulator [Micromonospora sp. M42]
MREAAVLADEAGYEKLTLAALAARLGVALPSLYKHVRGVDALHQQLAVLATAEIADVLTTAAAGRAGGDALRAVAAAYRAYARQHPGRYPAAQRAPDPADAEHLAAGERAVGAIRAILLGYGLDGGDALRAVAAAYRAYALRRAGGGRPPSGRPTRPTPNTSPPVSARSARSGRSCSGTASTATTRSTRSGCSGPPCTASSRWRRPADSGCPATPTVPSTS